MIRKLKSGSYRLYSRKLDARTGKRRNLGTFRRERKPSATSAQSNTSSTADEREEDGGEPPQGHERTEGAGTTRQAAPLVGGRVSVPGEPAAEGAGSS